MAKFEIVGPKYKDERMNKAAVEVVDRKVTDKQKMCCTGNQCAEAIVRK